jgi:hypothetical protein
MQSEPAQFYLKHINLPGHSFRKFLPDQQFLRPFKPGFQIPGPGSFLAYS